MKKRILLILAVAILGAAGALMFRFLPGGGLALGDGPVRVYCGADGVFSLEWPAAEEEEAEYLLSVRPEGGSWSEPERYGEPSAVLEDVRVPFQARIQAVAPGGSAGKWKLTIDVDAAPPEAPELTGDVADHLVSLSWTGGTDGVYEIRALSDGALLAEVEGFSLDLRFGPGEALELPGENQPLQLTVRAGMKGRHYVLYGPPSAPYTVRRGALAGSPLSLTCQETESRKYVLSWNETRGSAYEVQEWQDGEWRTLVQQPADGPARYETDRLASGSYHRFRVTACDAAGAVLDSQELEFYASVDPLYATIWPIMDLNLCKNAGGTGGTIRKIPAGTALCVLEEQSGWFRVRCLNDYGYVDSRFCMINLAEYIGDYCAYDITNSYSSIFKVHNSAIAKITNQVVPGFEHIQTASGFLVPYLYPCAQKLLTAAKAVMEDGYRLRIYEAYRPNQATRYLYDTTAAQLNYAALVERNGAWVDPQLNVRVDLTTGLYTDPATGKQVSRSALLPEEPPKKEAPDGEDGEVQPEGPEASEGTGTPLEDGGQDEGGLPKDPSAVPETPGGEAVSAPQPEETEPPLPEEEGPSLPEAPEDIPAEGFLQDLLVMNANANQAAAQSSSTFDTYNKIMTDNGRFGLGSFLARVTSAHNRGIALDLTLETLEDGKTLEMQSAMHDLSWYSATYRNNENAKLLEKYMTATGMRGLSSEWWHFQDDETREAIGLNTYLSKGVDASGWTCDDHGWRWRDAAGVPQRNTTITVDGVRWTLDASGYVVE